jgi:hypothetical protein
MARRAQCAAYLIMGNGLVPVTRFAKGASERGETGVCGHVRLCAGGDYDDDDRGGISITGNGAVSLAAPTSGPYAGIASSLTRHLIILAAFE